ncbi:hypothetical protein GBA52_014563 [Prunus armeniaca]|nr:hypothetical protein GBA52_014563 [Prunus armeniaca]
MTPSDGIQFNFVANSEEVYYSFSVRSNSESFYSRLIVNPNGELQRLTWIESRNMWNKFWYAPKDQCDDYSECGPYGICDSNASPVCKCLKGFEPKNLQTWDLRDGSDGRDNNSVGSTQEFCQDGDGKTKRLIMIVGIVVGIGILLAGLAICFVWKRKLAIMNRGRIEQKGTTK